MILRVLTLLSILLWSVFDPLRDLWYPCVPPEGGSSWWDTWHCIKHISHYPLQACLLWWMWPLYARSSLLKRVGYNPSRRFFWHNGFYWIVTAAASWAIWRLVIHLAGGW